MRSFSKFVLLTIFGFGSLVLGQTPNAQQNSKTVSEPIWRFVLVPSDITLFGKPIDEHVPAQSAKMPALDSKGNVIGQYEIIASCLAGAFHFRVVLRSMSADSLVQFKQLNLHLNDSTNPYGLGSMNRDPWTRSEISLDEGAPITVLSNDMADTGKDYQSTFLFSKKTGQATGNHLFWVGQKSVFLAAHKLVVTQTLDDDRKVSFALDPQAKQLKEFLMTRCGTN